MNHNRENKSWQRKERSLLCVYRAMVNLIPSTYLTISIIQANTNLSIESAFFVFLPGIRQQSIYHIHNSLDIIQATKDVGAVQVSLSSSVLTRQL